MIQPVSIYIRSSAQAESIKDETVLSFDDVGMHISVNSHGQLIKWKDYKTTINRPFVLIPIPDVQHAYILTDRILKGQRRELFDYIQGRKQ